MTLPIVIGKSVATTITKKFGGVVIERWTRHRAERFFEGFVEVIGNEFTTGKETEKLDKRLDEILSDDAKSEVLFDAYRRVCFSKSKTLGPRIVGLLTGYLVLEGRMANEDEESVFEAAELLSDGEFVEFMKSYQKYRNKAKGITDSEAECYMLGGSVIIHWSEESADTSIPSGGKVDISPFPWEEALGRWAVKLNAVGLVEVKVEQVTTQNYQLPSDDQSISTNINTMVIFSPACCELYDLLFRCFGAADTAAEI